ncbi:Protein CBG26953 [Caenorhabditis briggsae]|uniref:Uncharacterized protein n=2 Tax=Caenorhabditis briggsae TaxID=6238 RepID=A0AAE9A4M1_CAEBR|nr:Protein CBG26953 [Caenorhabditis briggsae]ULT87108.1 hypothetical protein L3Y34_006700 [Caenorhabditis briggsae]CAR99476.1 Protein CBG26953 [Caenorhabditis briggsae]
MTKYQTGFLEIVDWVRKFFKCEPTEIKIGTGCITNYDEILHWEPLLNTPNLVIKECNQSQFILEMLEKRHEKKLRTHIRLVDISHPRSISIESLSYSEYIRNFLIQGNSEFLVLRAAIPDWPRDQVNAFGTDLNLEHFDINPNRTHAPQVDFFELQNDIRMFQMRKNDTSVLVFHFSQDTLGFDKMAITVWF